MLFTLAAIILLALLGTGWWTYSHLSRVTPQEVVLLNSEKRLALVSLREESKFQPHEYPPLGYTGIATPEEGIVAEAAVNDVIETILSHKDGPIAATSVSNLIERGMKRVDLLETEDRDRTADYMIEIWYFLGFKSATGQFAYGSAFQRPDGYGEPLPPGWKSPAKPRLIGHK